MGFPGGDTHFKRIDTLGSLVCQAHDGDGPADEASDAQRKLLELNGGAIQRYLTAVLRNPDAAADLFQAFDCRFLRGARAHEGRFRDFVKGVLFKRIADHHHLQQRQRTFTAASNPQNRNTGGRNARPVFPCPA